MLFINVGFRVIVFVLGSGCFSFVDSRCVGSGNAVCIEVWVWIIGLLVSTKVCGFGEFRYFVPTQGGVRGRIGLWVSVSGRWARRVGVFGFGNECVTFLGS